MKPLFVTLLSAGVLAGALCAPALAQTTTNATPPSAVSKMTELFGDKVIARGKGFEIKRSQLDAALMGFKAAAAARGQPLPPVSETRVQQALLWQLIRIHMLLARATEADWGKGREEGQKRLEDTIQRAGGETNAIRHIKSMGLSLDELKACYIEEATAEVVMAREIPVTVTDEEVREFYDENPARFEDPEMVRVSHLLLSTMDTNTRVPVSEAVRDAKRKQAELLLQRARQGEDFTNLVREYSEDQISRERGGLYVFARGQVMMELEAAAFTLGPNQISDVITSQAGFHIIKVLERIPAKKIEFAKVADRIKQLLTQQAIQKQLPDYFKKRRAAEPVEILEESLKSSDEEADLLMPVESKK